MDKKALYIAVLDFSLAAIALLEIRKIKRNLEEIKASYNRTGRRLIF
jgi:hypothetical protein|nr:MAG TPA: hypothetical protein [Caudoviricetes sp.]